MKDDDDLPTSTSTLSSSSPSSRKYSSYTTSIFGKGRYKFCALALILLLALWSMFTGTIHLRLSAGNLNRISDQIDSPIHDDLDVLEMEEREKVVMHMWDVYTHNSRIRLPRFWQEAFEAAYEDLTSDDSNIRNAAILEIAKMSIRSVDIEPPPAQPTAVRDFHKSFEQVEKTKVV